MLGEHYNEGMKAKQKLPKMACMVCLTEFQPTRAWHVFCSTGCRDKSRGNEELAEYACHYCGLLADGIDHVPPRSVRPTLIEMGLKSRYPFVQVRCCLECNVLLGRQALWTVSQRRLYLAKRLAQRYAYYLAVPDWDDSELGALSDMLRNEVLHRLAVRDLSKQRITRCNNT